MDEQHWELYFGKLVPERPCRVMRRERRVHLHRALRTDVANRVRCRSLWISEPEGPYELPPFEKLGLGYLPLATSSLDLLDSSDLAVR